MPDDETKEGILEWIQVVPGFRKKGIGTAIVNQLLYRLSLIADFATVSEKVKNETKPEKLYRKCGFVGNDIWHILRK
ncbi:MAG: GNAT family N-acetyltransferase [Clostridiales bacterium]|nr:GNAT family N-acetyltransferase [Clostridiales bacterium]